MPLLYKVHYIINSIFKKTRSRVPKKQGNKQPINDKTYVKLFECKSGSFFGGTVGQKGAILVVLLSVKHFCLKTLTCHLVKYIYVVVITQ